MIRLLDKAPTRSQADIIWGRPSLRSLIFFSFLLLLRQPPILLNAFICSWLRHSPASQVILAHLLLSAEVVEEQHPLSQNHSFLLPLRQLPERKKNPIN